MFTSWVWFRCKIQALLWVIIYYLFNPVLYLLNGALKGLGFCNSLLVTMWPWTGELYFIFKNSVIQTVVLQPDKVKFCLFSVMIRMVWASLPVQTYPEHASQQLCLNWTINIFSLWSATTVSLPQGHVSVCLTHQSSTSQPCTDRHFVKTGSSGNAVASVPTSPAARQEHNGEREKLRWDFKAEPHI